MLYSNEFKEKALRLSNQSRNPQRAWESMRRTIKDTLSLLQAVYVLDLLTCLRGRGLAVNAVSDLSRKLCTGLQRERHKTIGDLVMKWKIDDARKQVKQRKERHTRLWREEESVLKSVGVKDRFLAIWEVEKAERRIELKNKMDNKVRCLLDRVKREREKREKTEVNCVREINYGDQLLGDKFESAPRCYGGAEVNNNEERVLSLTPRFAIYDRVDSTKCRAELEKCLTKIRLERSGKKRTNTRDVEDHERSESVSSSLNSTVTVSGSFASDVNVRDENEFQDLTNGDDSVFVDPLTPSSNSGTPHSDRQRPFTRSRARKKARRSVPATEQTGPTDTVRPTTDERQPVFDSETSTIDLRNLRSTDLPTNSYFHMPPALEEEEEIKLQDLKQDLLKATNEYIKEVEEDMAKQRKRKRATKFKNLTQEESRGLEDLMKRDDVVVFQTDKTGRLAVDTKENYIAATLPHIVGDELVDEKEHETLQKEINAHTTMWLRISKAGERTGNETDKGSFNRIKNSLKVSNHGYAPLYTLRKDHKVIEDPDIGPPTRPVCGGNEAYNSKLSHLLGYFLRPVWQGSRTTCTGTEELLAEFERLNSSGEVDDSCTLGSLDVKALYPSLDVDFTSKIVGEMFYKSGVNVASVNHKELGLYLALNMSPAELREKGLLDYCPERKSQPGKKPKGRKPNMTGCATDENEEKRFKPWKDPANKEPSEDIKKKMLAEGITIAVKVVMSNHLYIFNKEVRRQSKGGPIGLALTGDVANVFMCWWDEELLQRMSNRGWRTPLYQRYIDDIDLMGKVRRMLEGEQGGKEKISMEDIQKEARKIHPSIDVTIDYPEKHEDKKMPTLDLKVWMEDVKEGERKIIHEFYHKSIASKAVVNARSAMPRQTMRTILTQEVLRVLRNCSTLLPWSTVCAHVEHMSARMQFSGHNKRMREQVIRSALKAYDRIKEKHEKGEEPMYRPKGWKKEEREKNKREKKKTWFRGKKRKNESVIFLPATPGGVLRRKYKEIIDRAGVSIAVVEVPGSNLKKRVQRSDPFREKYCRKKESCMVCSGGGSGRCREEGVTYELVCECGARYIGESSRNAFARGLEHRTALIKKDVTSPLVAHCIDEHGGRRTKFTMNVTGRFRGDPMKRQISESIFIEQTENILNRRDEWRQLNLPRSEIRLV